MAEMRVARGAHHFDPAHAVGRVIHGLHVLVRNRLREAGPAAAGIELRVRAEQLRPARYAAVHTGLLRVVIRARERPLGPLLARDPVLLGRELLPPLLIGLSL